MLASAGIESDNRFYCIFLKGLLFALSDIYKSAYNETINHRPLALDSYTLQVMDTFVSRKRKREGSAPLRDQALPTDRHHQVTLDEEESTDVKVAILASLAPAKSQENLLELLISCDGSVGKASSFLRSETKDILSARKKSGSIGLQSSLPFTASSDTSPSKSATVDKEGLDRPPIHACRYRSAYAMFRHPQFLTG